MKCISLFALYCLLVTSNASAHFQQAWKEEISGTTGVSSPLGDIDADGDVDAIFVHIIHDSTVLLNNGNARFTKSATSSSLPSAGAAELGDVDGDGDLDLFLARHLFPCQVWLNDGLGNFTDSGQRISSERSRTGMAMADLDGDLDLDVVLPTSSSGETSEVWLNNGSGVFLNSGQSLYNTGAAQNVTLGDIDSDGDKDIVFASNGLNTIWKNNGSAVFTQSVDNLGANNTFDIGLADLDSDGDLDAFVVNGVIPPSVEYNQVWLNNGTGVFTNSGQSLGTDFSLSVILQDVDNDGDTDAVVGTNTTMPNRLFYNNGSGVFTQQAATLGTGACFDIRSADLDGDGDKDYFLPCNGGPAEVWRRVPVGQGLFSKTNQNLGSGSSSAVAKGDFDGDGDSDIIHGSDKGELRLIRNDGSGEFSDTTVLLLNGFTNITDELLSGDLDGDGDLDLFTIQSAGSPAGDMSDRAWLNDGSGNFTAGAQSFLGQSGGCGVLVDLDGDNDLDVIVGNAPVDASTGQNKILYNNGAGNFTEVNALGLGNTRGIAIGELNGAPGLDAFVCDFSAGSAAWTNNSGTFTSTGQSLETDGLRSVVLHDFDGDGDLDAICARRNGGAKLFLNNGSAIFTPSSQPFGGQSIRKIVLIDAEGDGDKDLWMCCGGDLQVQASQLWLNAGGGVFSLSANYGSQSAGAAVVDDFTGDGLPDLFTTTFSGDHQLWENITGNAIVRYAISFGLGGGDTDPSADPDHDGIVNYAEMAYNMNPKVADATVIGNLSTAVKGLPKIRCEVNGSSRTFIAETIRRKNVPELLYRLQVGADLIFTGQVNATIATQPLNTDYERATYTWVVPGTPSARFGRFGVFYEP